MTTVNKKIKDINKGGFQIDDWIMKEGDNPSIRLNMKGNSGKMYDIIAYITLIDDN